MLWAVPDVRGTSKCGGRCRKDGAMADRFAARNALLTERAGIAAEYDH